MVQDQLNLIKNQLLATYSINGQHLLKSVLDNNYLDGFREVKSTTILQKKDGGKDILFEKNKIPGVAFCYFPDGKKEYKEAKKKLIADLESFEKFILKQLEAKILLPMSFIISFGTNQELSSDNRIELHSLINEKMNPFYSDLKNPEFFDSTYITQELIKPLNLFLKAEIIGKNYLITNYDYSNHSLALSEKYRLDNLILKKMLNEIQYNYGLHSFPKLNNYFNNNILTIMISLQGKGKIMDLFSYTFGLTHYDLNGAIVVNNLVFDLSNMIPINIKITKSCAFNLVKVDMTDYLHLIIPYKLFQFIANPNLNCTFY
jgi:hypothetical protein